MILHRPFLLIQQQAWTQQTYFFNNRNLIIFHHFDYLIGNIFKMDDLIFKLFLFKNPQYWIRNYVYGLKVSISITLVVKNFGAPTKVSYFPNLGWLIPNPTIIFWYAAQVFAVFLVWRFLVKNYVYKNISIFWNFKNFCVLILKGNEIVSSLQKKSSESYKRLWRYCSSKLKNHQNFATLISFNFTGKLS